jgi:hypothetical protein
MTESVQSNRSQSASVTCHSLVQLRADASTGRRVWFDSFRKESMGCSSSVVAPHITAVSGAAALPRTAAAPEAAQVRSSDAVGNPTPPNETDKECVMQRVQPQPLARGPEIVNLAATAAVTAPAPAQAAALVPEKRQTLPGRNLRSQCRLGPQRQQPQSQQPRLIRRFIRWRSLRRRLIQCRRRIQARATE